MRDVGAVPCSTGPMPPTAHPLRLVPVRHQDQAAAVAVHDDPSWAPFTFLYGYDPNGSWAEYVSWLADVHRGVGLGPSEVPATFLLAWVDGELVGRTSIRHELNDYLEAYSGHIGYGVVPNVRRRGYATEILRQSLVLRGLLASWMFSLPATRTISGRSARFRAAAGCSTRSSSSPTANR